MAYLVSLLIADDRVPFVHHETDDFLLSLRCGDPVGEESSGLGLDEGISRAATAAQSYFYQIIAVFDGNVQAERLLSGVVFRVEHGYFLSFCLRRKGGEQKTERRRNQGQRLFHDIMVYDLRVIWQSK